MNGINNKGSGDTQIQIALSSLLDCAIDKNCVVSETVTTSLRKIAKRHPNDVLQVCCVFGKQHTTKENKPIPDHVGIVLKIMEDICREHIVAIDGDTLMLLVDLCLELMTQNTIYEPHIQMPASDVLVALGTKHCIQIVDALCSKLTVGVVPHYTIPHTLGSLASANAFGVVPYLKSILGIMLPLLGALKQDPMRQSFAYSLGRFSDAIMEYTSSPEQAPDPTITAANFHTEICMAYDVLFSVWLHVREPKLVESVLYALAAMFNILSVENVRQQTHKSIQVLLQQYRKHKEYHSLTKCIGSILSVASNTDGTLLEPQLNNILHTLSDLVCITPDYAQPELLRTHSEVLRCYECLCMHYTDHTLDHILSQIKNNDKERIKGLVVLTHLTNAADGAIKNRLKDILNAIDGLLNDSHIRVKRALMKCIVALAYKGFLNNTDVPTEKFLQFIVRLCCKQSSTVNQTENYELSELKQTADNNLYMLSTSVKELETVLWKLLLNCLLTYEYSDACIVLLRCLTHLASRKTTKESCTGAFVRCLALLAHPLNGFRGTFILNFLRNINLCDSELYKPVWDTRVPHLLKYLEQNYDSFSEKEWEDLVFDFLNALLGVVNDGQFQETLVSCIREQLPLYINRHINKLGIARKKYKLKDSTEIHSYLEDFDEEATFTKKIFYLPSDGVWANLIIVMGMINSSTAMVIAIFANIDTTYTGIKRVIFYVLDLCWFCDIMLSYCGQFVPNLRASLVSPAIKSHVILITQIIAVLPLELFAVGFTDYTKNMIALNRVLKVIQVINIFSFLNSSMECSIPNRVFQMFYLYVHAILFCTIIFAAMVCPQDLRCSTNFVDDFFAMLMQTSGHITGKSFGRLSTEMVEIKLFMTIVGLCSFFAIYCIYTSHITFAFFRSALHKTDFHYRLKAINLILYYRGVSPNLSKLIGHYYNKIWKTCDGYEGYMAETKQKYGTQVFLHLLPKAMYTEIEMDISWGTFAHSLVFRNMDLPFLRDLSTHMKHEVYVSGQYLFHRDSVKDKMVYLISGIIQILSEEDGETAIVSLSDGTCLGESSLVVPYKSNVNVRCLKTCVLQVLERNSFLQIMEHYPLSCRKVVLQIAERFVEGKHVHLLKKIVNEKPYDLLKRTQSLLWVNYTLHKIMSMKDSDSARKHAIQNIYIQGDINDATFKNHIFCAENLCLLSTTERFQVDRDALFITATFPYLLRPQTKLLFVWDLFICCMALIAGVRVPYISLVTRISSTTFYTTIYGFTFIWVLDIFLQIRTAVEMKHKILTKPTDIMGHLVTDFGFIVDVICALPLEVCSGVFISSQSDILYINRCVKLFRVYRLLMKWERQYNSNAVLVRVICITMVLCYGSFIIGCFYYSIKCLDMCGLSHVLTLAFYALQIATGIGLDVPLYGILKVYNGLNVLMFLFMGLFYCVFYGYIFAAFAFTEWNRIDMQYAAKRIIDIVTTYDRKLVKQIVDDCRTQSALNLNLVNFYPDYAFMSIPIPVIGYSCEKLVDMVYEMPLFDQLPKYVLIDIFENAIATFYVAPGETVLQIGELSDDIYILINGVIEKVSAIDHHIDIIKDRQMLNDMEVCLNIPTRSKIFSLSTCYMINLNYSKMCDLLTKYPSWMWMSSALGDITDLRENILKVKLRQLKSGFCKCKYLDEGKKSFVKHIQSLEYQRHFKVNFTNRLLSFILMPRTILPHGKFFLNWEVCRCAAAIVSSLLYTTTYVSFFSPFHPIKLLLRFLDITAIVDIYVRAHICYHDERGILITHPLYTTLHYAKNGFPIDFISIIPMNIFINRNIYLFLNLNRILSVHRYYSFIKYKKTDAVVPLMKYYMLENIPLLLITFNLFASTLVAMNCTGVVHAKPVCSRFSVLSNYPYDNQIHPLQLHMRAFYIIVSIISCVGMQGFKIRNGPAMVMIAIMSLWGFFWNALMAAYIFGYYIFESKSLIHHEIFMGQINKFMYRKHIPPALQKHVNEHLHYSKYIEKSNVHDTLGPFNRRIRRDVLFTRFGIPLLDSCLGTHIHDLKPFLRNILPFTSYKIIDSEGYVLTLNDIMDETLILTSGIIEVIGPDGVVLQILRAGSIFGNLRRVKYNRIVVSLVSAGMTEVLAIKSEKFFEILSHFPSSLREFLRLRTEHESFIPGFSRFKDTTKHMPKRVGKRVLEKDSLVVFYVGMSLLLFGTYMSQIIYLYQVACSEFSLIVLCLSLFSDILFGSSLILDFYIAIEDERYGVIRDDVIIHKFWLNQKLLKINIASLVPIGYIAYFFYNHLTVRYYLFVFCRLNVMLRSWDLKLSYKRYNIRYNMTNMFISRFCLKILIVILTLFVFTALFMFCADIWSFNMNVNISRHNLIISAKNWRFQRFVYWFFIICNMFTHTSQSDNYPIDVGYFLLCTIIMLYMMVYLAYILSNIISVVFATNQNKLNYLILIDHLNSFMTRYEVTLSMADKVRYYVAILYRQQGGFKYPPILKLTPQYLQEAVLWAAFGHHIEFHPLFGRCHNDFKRQLVLKLNIDYYYHGDYVQFKGGVNDTMYWVQRGLLVALSEQSEFRDDIVRHYRPGDHFGSLQGVFKIPHLYSYRASMASVVLSLHKTQWEYFLDFFPASRELIYQQCEYLLFENEAAQL